MDVRGLSLLCHELIKGEQEERAMQGRVHWETQVTPTTRVSSQVGLCLFN